MSPDKKFMGSKNTTASDDLNLVPFKTSMPAMMPIGWIPIYSFNKLNTPSMPTSMLPDFSNINSNFNNSFSPQNKNSVKSADNPENFPSDEGIDNLYSYNKASSNTSSSSNSMNSSNNMSSPGSMSSTNSINSPNNMNPANFNTGSMSSLNRSENISDVLRNYFADLDEDTDLCRHCSDKRIDKIYAKIQEKDPEIISMLVEHYEIPCPIAKAAIRKIIKLSLHYCKKAGD